MTEYFKFNGVATRSEYWAVMIIANIVGLVLGVAGGAMIGAEAGLQVFGLLLLLATVIAQVWLSFATGARRSRDAGINPWWVLTFLLPYINIIVLIVIGVLKTQENKNEMA